MRPADDANAPVSSSTVSPSLAENIGNLPSGAEAFLAMREEIARDLDIGYTRLLGTIERHNAFEHDPVKFRGGWQMDADELWTMSGLTPGDVDVVQTYDEYPVISMTQFEDLGFCGKGEGPAFVRQHEFTVDGSFPHNTSGGQLSVGQARAAGGSLGMVAALRQLTGNPVGAAVEGADIGLVSGFGMMPGGTAGKSKPAH